MNERVPALRMIGLHKAFRDAVAVDHIDLTVPSGSFFGLVGPNGAGKTTALSMAVGLLPRDVGRSEVLGVDVWADPMRARQLMWGHVRRRPPRPRELRVARRVPGGHLPVPVLGENGPIRGGEHGTEREVARLNGFRRQLYAAAQVRQVGLGDLFYHRCSLR